MPDPSSDDYQHTATFPPSPCPCGETHDPADVLREAMSAVQAATGQEGAPAHNCSSALLLLRFFRMGGPWFWGVHILAGVGLVEVVVRTVKVVAYLFAGS